MAASNAAQRASNTAAPALDRALRALDGAPRASDTAPQLLPIVVVGAGPAGLMAAERIAAAGLPVEVFDAMPSAGRKFLLAGRGGLNLTHSEAPGLFLSRYRERQEWVAPWLEAFGPQALREWAQVLGIETFVGSSGRIFPREMKAAPLLRAWLQRLRSQGVRFAMRHRWVGWGEHPLALRFESPQGPRLVQARALVLALGGASWSRLGSDGAWAGLLQALGVPVAPLRPSNCGFDLGRIGGRNEPGWSRFFVERFAGQPLKTVAVRLEGGDQAGAGNWRTGDFVVTDSGVEGSLIYALSADLREAIAAQGSIDLLVDLAPGRSRERLATDLARPRKGRSFANQLRSRAGIEGLKAGLLREAIAPEEFEAVASDPDRLTDAIKTLRLPLVAARPLDEAISTAGGIRPEGLDEHLMLRGAPGVFCAGEMLDWEAPTGGYLLNACLASGRVAGDGAVRHLQTHAAISTL